MRADVMLNKVQCSAKTRHQKTFSLLASTHTATYIHTQAHTHTHTQRRELQINHPDKHTRVGRGLICIDLATKISFNL